MKKIIALLLSLAFSICSADSVSKNLHYSKAHNNFSHVMLSSNSPIPPQNGGTGASNASTSIITLGGTLQTAANLTFAGAYNSTLNFATASNITFPSGTYTLAEIAGSNATGTWPISITGTAATVTTIPNLTGDITSVGNATTLATVNSNVGSFGSATQVGTFTVNSKGLITAAGNTTISGVAPGGTAGGDLSGSYPNPATAKINGVALGSTTATSGNILIGSGTQWVTNPVSGNVTISSTGVTAIGAVQVTNAMLAGSIDLTSKVVNTLPFSNGGFGFSTATIGDIFLATGTNTPGKLSDIATGSVLSSGGVGVIPAWLAYATANTASTIVARDSSGNFSAGTITAALSGNATSATNATNATNIATVSSSINASEYILFVSSTTNSNQAANLNSNLNYNPLSGVLTLPNITVTAPSANQLVGLNVGNNLVAIGAGTATTILHGNAAGLPTYSAVSLTADVTGVLPNGNTTGTSANTASAIVARDGSGNFTAGTITAALSGNATTATTATNANNIATTQVSSNASYFPLMASSSTNGNQAADLGTGLTFNPSTNTLTTNSLVLSGLTLRSVLYASASGGINQDNANFIYDGSGHNLYLGTNNVSTLNGPGRLNLYGTDSTALNSEVFYTSADLYPLIQILPFVHDNVSYSFDAYYGAGWISSSSNSSFQIAKTATALNLNYGVATQGSALTWTTGLSLGSTGLITAPQLTINSLVATNASNVLISSNTLSPTVLGNISKATVTTFTGGASGNYTPPTNCTHIVVEGWGGGGGGGGVAGSAANAGAASGGGGGGGFRVLLTAPFSSPYAYSVGSGGAGGVAGANNGSVGGSTTFGSYTAGHGAGGTASTAGIALAYVAGGNITASSGAADVISNGIAGFGGFVLTSSIAAAGNGGSGAFGGAGGRASLNGAGGAGNIPGGGGAGAASTGASSFAGGAGADGKIVIYEYYNG